jgi:hypothetical protein
MLEQIDGANFCGVNINTLRKSSNLEIMFYGFPREKRHTWANLRKDGLTHSRYNIAYPITLFLCMLTILNSTQYWSICGSDIKGDSKFRKLKVLGVYRF